MKSNDKEHIIENFNIRFSIVTRVKGEKQQNIMVVEKG